MVLIRRKIKNWSNLLLSSRQPPNSWTWIRHNQHPKRARLSQCLLIVRNTIVMGFRDLTRRLNSRIRVEMRVVLRGIETVHLHQTETERLIKFNSRRRYWEATLGQVKTVSRSSSPQEAGIKSVSVDTLTVKWATISRATGRLTQVDRCWPKEAAHIITSRILAISSRSSNRINRWRRSSLIHREEATLSQRTRSSTRGYSDSHSSRTTNCRCSLSYQAREIRKLRVFKQLILLGDQDRIP